MIYSDNGGTFVKTNKWLTQLRKDERLHDYLDEYEINWKFNLIGVVKAAMYKVIGGGVLTWEELSEVLLDVETQINRRPLSYVEDDVELPVLTPSSFLFQRTNQIPEQESWRIEDPDLRKRVKYLKNCKDDLWKRWKKEYLAALRERHNLTHKVSKFQPQVGDVVIIKTDNKNRGTWPLAIVSETYPGKDGIIRAVELKTAHGRLERPVQHLYPLEITCDKNIVAAPPRQAPSVQLDPNLPAFRPRRDAAVAARARIQELDELNQDI